jgi:invasion protein IalB
MTLPLQALLTALSLTFALPGAAVAQEAAPTEQNITAQETPWQVNCTPAGEGAGLNCSMVKSLILAQGEQVLAQAAVVQGDPLVLRILVPHGMALEAGLVILVDGAEVARPTFRTSLPGGAIAVTDITPDLEDALRSGAVLQIAGTQNNGNALRLEMSLLGFSASVDKLLQD